MARDSMEAVPFSIRRLRLTSLLSNYASSDFPRVISALHFVVDKDLQSFTLASWHQSSVKFWLLRSSRVVTLSASSYILTSAPLIAMRVTCTALGWQFIVRALPRQTGTRPFSPTKRRPLTLAVSSASLSTKTHTT